MTRDRFASDNAGPSSTPIHKADFGSLYTSPDPRAYFTTLGSLDYQIPQHAAPVIERVLDLARQDASPVTVLDVCCSYGITSAMLFGPAGPQAAAQRYASPGLRTMSTADLAAADRDYFTPRRRPERILGMDVSASGIAYGLQAGLLDGGWVEDLERHDPSTALVAGLRDVNVIVCTGGYGYIGPPTYRRLLAAIARPHRAWAVTFVLRTFDFTPVATLFAQHGLVTERLPGTFRQRRFVDRAEHQATVDAVQARGLDTTGLEEAGWFHAEGFVSRPTTPCAP